MTFLNLGALFGLAAVAIPIVIHLLNRFRVREVTWAAMRFLRESIEKNQRRLQMEDILLLIVRCLVVALLILALSRPTWQSGARTTGSHQVAAVIIIDDSASMGLTNGIQTSLQRAQSAAEQILAAFPTGSSSALFFAADNVQPVIAQPTYDFNLLRERIRHAKLTDRSTDLSNALQLAVATLQKQEGGEAREIYLITDGQANGWPALDHTTFALEALRETRAAVVSQDMLAAKDLNWDAAVAFLQRCQNLPKYNAQPWVTGDPKNVGGFIYTPLASDNHAEDDMDGKKVPRSYGSMSYSGLLSYIYADLQKDDPRVTAVYDWLGRNYTVEENPGLGPSGLFYYYHTMSKALSTYGVDQLTLAGGKSVNWREDLALKLIDLQASEGSWINEKSGRWWEKDPVLVTAYAVRTLEMMHAGV